VEVKKDSSKARERARLRVSKIQKPKKPIQQVQERPKPQESRLKTLAKFAKEGWFWVSWPSVALTAIFNIMPHVGIAPSTTLDATSSFGTLIAVSNTGHINLTNVEMECIIDSPPTLVNVVTAQHAANKIRPGHSVSYSCSVESPNYQRDAKIKIAVNYRWMFGLLGGEEHSFYSSSVDKAGKSILIPSDES